MDNSPAEKFRAFPFVEHIANRNGGKYITRVHLTPFAWWPANWDRFYLHLIHFSDIGVMGQEVTPHDHPWDFRTLVLWGGYKEFFGEVIEKAGKLVFDDPQYRHVVFSFEQLKNFLRSWKDQRGLRGADFAHQIVDLLGNNMAITLVRRSPRGREWGFYVTDREGDMAYIHCRKVFSLDELPFP